MPHLEDWEGKEEIFETRNNWGDFRPVRLRNQTGCCCFCRFGEDHQPDNKKKGVANQVPASETKQNKTKQKNIPVTPLQAWTASD